MATFVNNQPPERVVEVRSDEGGAGWGVAVIILILVIAGLIWWYYTYHQAQPAAQTNSPGATVQVNLPVQGSTGGTGNASGGGGTTGGTGGVQNY